MTPLNRKTKKVSAKPSSSPFPSDEQGLETMDRPTSNGNDWNADQDRSSTGPQTKKALPNASRGNAAQPPHVK